MKQAIVLLCLMLVSCELLSADIVFRRDPFQAMSSQGLLAKHASYSQSAKVKLKLIIWDEQLPLALVSIQGQNRTLVPGDQLYNFQVSEISRHDVILENEDQRVILDFDTELLP